MDGTHTDFCVQRIWRLAPGKPVRHSVEEATLDRLRHLVLPLIASVAGHLWYFAYMVRNMLCEETRSEYIVLARAKGTKTAQSYFGTA